MTQRFANYITSNYIIEMIVKCNVVRKEKHIILAWRHRMSYIVNSDYQGIILCRNRIARKNIHAVNIIALYLYS